MVFGDFDQITDKANFLSKCSIKYAPATCVGKFNTPTNLQNTTRFKKRCFSKALLRTKLVFKLCYLEENGCQFYYE